MSATTPQQVEQRLIDLGRELDSAQASLSEAEYGYWRTKTEAEIGLAQARLSIGREAADGGWRVTVQEREDQATVRCAHLIQAVNTAEATVRAMRGNVARVKVHIDIARSVGTSVRAALDLT